VSDDLQGTVQRLTDVLRRENDALKRLDFTAAGALGPEKEAALAGLTKQSEGRILSPPLVALGRRLAELATENQLLLERAIAVQTRIVRIVARAAAPPPAMMRYGGHGRRTPPHRTAAMALSTRA
jgi:hypothetical protein